MQALWEDIPHRGPAHCWSPKVWQAGTEQSNWCLLPQADRLLPDHTHTLLTQGPYAHSQHRTQILHHRCHSEVTQQGGLCRQLRHSQSSDVNDAERISAFIQHTHMPSHSLTAFQFSLQIRSEARENKQGLLLHLLLFFFLFLCFCPSYDAQRYPDLWNNK